MIDNMIPVTYDYARVTKPAVTTRNGMQLHILQGYGIW